MKRCFAVFAAVLTSMLLVAQTPATAGGPLTCHYREGQTLTYHMVATNDGQHYTADASGAVTKTADGSYVVRFRWTGMTAEGKSVELAPAMKDFVQPLSLDPNWMPSMPDLSKADPRMVGPITDLMTFYVDLWLANKIGALQHSGDHFYMPNPQANSWADGTSVLIGKDQIDFDLKLKSIDSTKHTAVLEVRHVPPAQSKLEFPAKWMETPVADAPNNWIEVSKDNQGKYRAGAGKESFDVLITVSTEDGQILSATMDNPVVMSGRECDDVALAKCGEAREHTIHRQVEIVLQR